jgi:hypothetical protein
MKLSVERESFRKSLDIDDFVTESRIIIQDYLCPLCGGIYLNPVVDSCGHVFCKTCIIKHLEISKTCPLSNNSLEESHLTVLVIVNNILEKQMINCKNRNFHCDWVGKLMELEGHLNKECRRQLLLCPHEGCCSEVFREDLHGHQEICDYRIVSCEDCLIQIPFINIRPHQDVCPKFKIICPQGCNCLIERQDTEYHIMNYCLNTIIDCPYTEYGCKTTCAKKELPNYLTESVNRHNFLILCWLKDYQNMLNTKTFSMEAALNSFDEKLKKLDHQNSLNGNSSREKDKENSQREFKEVNLNSDTDSKKKNKKSIENLITVATSGSNQIGEKYLTKKRQRLEEDSPIISNRKEKIELEILDEKEGTVLTENSLNLTTNSVSELNQNPKIENTFDQLNISKGIQIQNSKAICLNNNKAEHRFAFCNINLNRNVEWKVTINPYSAGWLALGICIKDHVIANKFRFVYNSPNFNHSFFGISTNGYLWNANNNRENNNYICNFPHITKGEVVYFKYLIEEKEILYKFSDNKFSGKISDVYPPKNSSICPCVIFLNSGDEVVVEFI